MTKRQTLIVKLRRPSKQVPWGISIAGGSDLGTPLIVTRSENENLQKGDVIKKIDEYDVRDLRHVDAQYLLQNSDCVKLAIERSESIPNNPIRSDYSASSSLVGVKLVVSELARPIARLRVSELCKHIFALLSEQLLLQFL